jgi:S-disulfanyl-L-cysteine oxidoreductase SoxD
MNSYGIKDRSNGRKLIGRAMAMAVTLGGAMIFALAGSHMPTAHAAPTKTTQDGVYTDSQATQGKAQYTQSCAACHMDDLSGSGQAPPLAGDAFSQVWDGHSVDELYELTRTTMPQDNPASLTPDQYVSIVAYLFQANKFPSGKDELKSDPNALKDITISGKKSGS